MPIIDGIRGFWGGVKAISNLGENSKSFGNLGELHTQLLNAGKEIERLRGVVRKLEGERDVEKQVKFDQGAYWLETETGRDGPFCHYCWDTDHKLVRPRWFGEHRSDRNGPYTEYYCDLHKVTIDIYKIKRT